MNMKHKALHSVPDEIFVKLWEMATSPDHVAALLGVITEPTKSLRQAIINRACRLRAFGVPLKKFNAAWKTKRVAVASLQAIVQNDDCPELQGDSAERYRAAYNGWEEGLVLDTAIKCIQEDETKKENK